MKLVVEHDLRAYMSVPDYIREAHLPEGVLFTKFKRSET